MKIGWLLGVLFVVSSFFLLLGVSFFGNAFSDAHYDFAQYSVEEKTAFSASLVNDAVVAYVSGSGDELLVDVFTADEVSHLSDVRAVVSVGRIMFMLSGVVFFLVLFSGYWMSAEEAVEYGLISKIIKTQSDLS